MDPWKLAVKAVPNASRDEVSGWLGGELKVRVAAPPEGGKANRRIVGMLAEFLGLPESGVRLVSGGSGARKVFEIRGSSVAELRAKLGGG